MKNVSQERKAELIGEFLSTHEGRNRLDQMMQAPLMQRRNYASIGRAAFTEDVSIDVYPGIEADTKAKIIKCAPEGVATSLDIHIRNDTTIIYRNRHTKDDKVLLTVLIIDFETALEWASTAGPEGWAQCAGDMDAKGLISRAVLAERLVL